MTARSPIRQHSLSGSRSNPAFWMALAFGFLIWGFSASAHASHGGGHAQGIPLEEPAALLFSTQADRALAEPQAQNPFTPYTASAGEIALDDGSLHCLLSAAIHKDQGNGSDAACRLFTLKGLYRNTSISDGWHLFKQEVTKNPQFFESGVRGPATLGLDALTGYIHDTYGISSMH
ncbi:hypothetical protein [Nitrospina watsonii]|uniref:Uncharacterized protein n=1 Tax=Nitrospina watsonii TaxID=1323948 RepID=A0ABN8W088_9BACT|nr:hypothetical protein [Nitrospina watsonii]CAI2717579.1 conserved protein of unknown function [Nitrospina watsonii]